MNQNTYMTQTSDIKNLPVPARYIGVWQRELLETQTIKDTTSIVLWMQSQHYHIDLRIPNAKWIKKSRFVTRLQ